MNDGDHVEFDMRWPQIIISPAPTTSMSILGRFSISLISIACQLAEAININLDNINSEVRREGSVDGLDRARLLADGLHRVEYCECLRPTKGGCHSSN